MLISFAQTDIILLPGSDMRRQGPYAASRSVIWEKTRSFRLWLLKPNAIAASCLDLMDGILEVA